MGSTTWRVAACLGLALGAMACQPLYGDRPEKPHNPERKKRPPEADVKDEPVKYVEECVASFQDDPKKKLVDVRLARQLIELGDAAVQVQTTAKEPKTQIASVLDAIDKYRGALTKDPYNAEATLKLAREYDKLLRKGCAVALLKRLAALTNSNRFRTEANRQIDSIADNAGWFRGYRKDAMSAVGR